MLEAQHSDEPVWKLFKDVLFRCMVVDDSCKKWKFMGALHKARFLLDVGLWQASYAEDLPTDGSPRLRSVNPDSADVGVYYGVLAEARNSLQHHFHQENR